MTTGYPDLMKHSSHMSEGKRKRGNISLKGKLGEIFSHCPFPPFEFLESRNRDLKEAILVYQLSLTGSLIGRERNILGSVKVWVFFHPILFNCPPTPQAYAGAL